MQSVLAVSLSPTFQKTMIFGSFHEDEVNRSSRFFEAASGKGINVSRVLNNLGRPAVNLMQLGGPRLNEFISLLDREKLGYRYIEVKAGIRSCLTIINEEKHTSTELVEEAQEVDPEASARIYDLFMSEVGNHSAVVISGTKAKGFSSSLLPSLVREARNRDKLVVLDIKGEDLKASLKYSPSVIKPNLSEFCSTFSISDNVLENSDNEDLKASVIDVMKSIYDEYRISTVITRGKYDTWIYGREGFDTVENQDVPVVNTIGCGDTLTAALTHSLLLGESLKTAVAFGMESALKKAQHLEQGI